MNLSRSGPSPRSATAAAGLESARGNRVTVGGLGTGLYYTERVPPATAPHGGLQTAFVVLILVAVMLCRLQAETPVLDRRERWNGRRHRKRPLHIPCDRACG
jgi:hypothetical protein